MGSWGKIRIPCAVSMCIHFGYSPLEGRGNFPVVSHCRNIKEHSWPHLYYLGRALPEMKVNHQGTNNLIQPRDSCPVGRVHKS